MCLRKWSIQRSNVYNFFLIIWIYQNCGGMHKWAIKEQFEFIYKQGIILSAELDSYTECD